MIRSYYQYKKNAVSGTAYNLINFFSNESKHFDTLTQSSYFGNAPKNNKPKFTLKSSEGYLTGVFFLGFQVDKLHHYGYGDIYRTDDGLIFIFDKDYLIFEMCIIPNGRKNISQLAHKVMCGKYDNELNSLRSLSKALILENSLF